MQEKAFKIGFALALGYSLGLRTKGLTFDANTNNPYWITTENGHHFLIDEEGDIQSGRFKGQPIGKIKSCWQHQHKKLSAAEFSRRKQYINNFKYAKTMPEKALAYIDSIIEEPKPTERDLKARHEFKQDIDKAIKQQHDDIQLNIEKFELNPVGVTELNHVSADLRFKLGLKPNKKIVLPLFSQKRALEKHANMDSEGFRKGLAYCLMASGLNYIPLKASKSNYSHIAVRIQNKSFGDLIIDLAERNKHYEIVHFHRNNEKDVEKKRI